MLATKLDALDLSDTERSVLHVVFQRAAQECESEVEGFTTLTTTGTTFAISLLPAVQNLQGMIDTKSFSMGTTNPGGTQPQGSRGKMTHSPIVP